MLTRILLGIYVYNMFTNQLCFGTRVISGENLLEMTIFKRVNFQISVNVRKQFRRVMFQVSSKQKPMQRFCIV